LSHLTGPDHELLALAGWQHAVVAWPQLRRAGVSEGWVRHRVTTGWLRRVHRGVYLVGPPEAEHSAAMAAVLAIGDGALLSHGAAAVLWALRSPTPGAIDVTVLDRRARSRHGITVHHARLHRADATRHHGIPVTSPARTLLDLAAQTAQRDLDRATEQAQVLRRVSVHSLNEQFRRYPRHRGTAALRELIGTDPKLTRSEAEQKLLALIRAARLPEPETNVRIAGYEVDFHWPTANLVVEVDGYAFHSTRSSFERDRRRDANLAAAGFRTARVTWRQLTTEPEALVATLARALTAP
jgi:very-short-patch-repair endonuclease